MRILKHVVGIILILIGVIALVTPLTPDSWLVFVGLELIGVRLAFWDKIKARFNTWRGLRSKDVQDRDPDTAS